MPTDANEPIIATKARSKSGLEESYRMIRLIGRGTMSSVYLAEQLSMARPLALKILSPALATDPAFVERFLREARASARLNHPNIVSAIDFGEIDNRYFLAMEYIDGETLASLIAREAPLEEARVIAIGHQVVLALEHAASHNVIHRDVKPANIMISKDGRVKLADFGLAILADTPGMAEASRKAVGTPYYMAPEQLEGGPIDWRADQCSLGASLYEAASGAKPFSGKSVSDVLTRRLFENPVPAWRVNRRVSRSFSAVLAKMLSRSPEDRYQNFSDLKKDFDRVASGKKPVFARMSSTTYLGPRAVRFSNAARSTVRLPSRLDAFSPWNVLLIVSLALIGILGAYALIHWDELAGPRPPSGEAPAQSAPGRKLSFSKYNEMRETWADALQRRILAEKTPTRKNVAQARESLRYFLDSDDYAGTVYRTMAAASLDRLERNARRWQESGGDAAEPADQAGD